MGAANVGKSSFINRLLESDYKKGVAGADKKRSSAAQRKDQTPQATVSNLPGTTLNFLKIKLPNGVTMIDTPGLINKGQLTSRLTTAELRQVRTLPSYSHEMPDCGRYSADQRSSVASEVGHGQQEGRHVDESM